MTRRRHLLVAVTVAASVALSLGGCAVGGSSTGDSSTGSSAAVPPRTRVGAPVVGELTVFAAASLTAAFDALAADFMAQNPAVTVNPIVYDGSSTLATQLKEGAVADVFASADQRTMAEVADAGLLDGDSALFATNTLQIIVAKGNPHGIASLSDLAADDLLVVLCAPAVPCGAASAELLTLDGVRVTAVSEEQNVKAVLTKVAAGEADAGLVYATDVSAAGGAVDGIAIDGAERARNSYAIGVPTASANPAAAKAFVDWVLSDAGMRILAGFGFAAP